MLKVTCELKLELKKLKGTMQTRTVYKNKYNVIKPTHN